MIFIEFQISVRKFVSLDNQICFRTEFKKIFRRGFNCSPASDLFLWPLHLHFNLWKVTGKFAKPPHIKLRVKLKIKSNQCLRGRLSMVHPYPWLVLIRFVHLPDAPDMPLIFARVSDLASPFVL